MIESIYIHIPFCSLKCPYCDFTSITINNLDIYNQYINTLLEELQLYRDNQFFIKTIYFGGGTPSILEPKQIGKVINYIKENFKTASSIEISIEMNPENYQLEDFFRLKEFGVNRVSIGNQSFLQKNLDNLGRLHKPENTFKAVENLLKVGIKNINLDLIFGIQGQTIDDLEKDLELYTALDITHISAYMLTPYEETPLGQLVKKGEYQMPSEDLLSEMYILIGEYLEEKGFHQYELSNWAKEGYQCKHNLSYWYLKEFLGIGVSSWSFVKNTRFGNTKNVYEYLNKISSGIKPILFKDKLDEKELLKEKIMLSLRLTEGVEKDLLKGKEKELSLFLESGLCRLEGSRVKLTDRGFLLSNYIISQLLPD